MDNLPLTNTMLLLEALLFAASEPLSLNKIAQITGEKKAIINDSLMALAKLLEEQKHGLRLINKGEDWFMVTAPEASAVVQKLRAENLEGNLSPASQEVLAIIAYKGPIPRSEINFIRGVDSTYTLHQLLSRGLIERQPDEKRANVFLYSISFKTLQYLGLTDIKQLPHYDEAQSNNSKIRNK
ncbi:MAG: Segregation and condensation protein B [Parcubacteria group bacterium ADurb.Bin305]|nr:SMC-Scp complex subunit ScpB [Candidatus Paceibacterota bacterium]MDD3434319.1 SMC-Scp complex subunit ScpB [Candidatus Paceibacterota bacterium]OQA44484.1 MAG: Segregation and condensation protein B [Parcubacteria group bacterium ADurb.Bin305]